MGTIRVWLGGASQMYLVVFQSRVLWHCLRLNFHRFTIFGGHDENFGLTGLMCHCWKIIYYRDDWNVPCAAQVVSLLPCTNGRKSLFLKLGCLSFKLTCSLLDYFHFIIVLKAIWTQLWGSRNQLHLNSVWYLLKVVGVVFQVLVQRTASANVQTKLRTVCDGRKLLREKDLTCAVLTMCWWLFLWMCSVCLSGRVCVCVSLSVSIDFTCPPHRCNPWVHLGLWASGLLADCMCQT